MQQPLFLMIPNQAFCILLGGYDISTLYSNARTAVPCRKVFYLSQLYVDFLWTIMKYDFLKSSVLPFAGNFYKYSTFVSVVTVVDYFSTDNKKAMNTVE